MKTIRKVTKGTIEPDETIVEYARANRKAIEMAVKAAGIEHCDWGGQFSTFDPNDRTINDMLYLAELVLADTRIRLVSENPQKLLQRCMNVYGISRHIVADDLGFVIRVVLEAKTSDTLAILLSKEKLNYQTLESLKQKIISHKRSRTPFIETFDSKTASILASMEKFAIDKSVVSLDELLGSDELLGNEELSFTINFQLMSLKDVNRQNCEIIYSGPGYYKQYRKSLRQAIQKPYTQAYPEMIKLEEKALDDSHTKDSTTGKSTINYDALFASDVGSVKGLYTISTKSDTHLNALLTAIDIYKTNAKTGKLPDKIPAGSPKDLCSDEDFTYKKTADGFILRSTGKNPYKKDEFFKWEFKTAK